MGAEKGFLTVLVLTSFCLNILVIVVLGKQWRTIKVRNMILISLAISDLGSTIIGFPLELVFNKNSEEVCKVAAYIVSSLALVSITHLVALSFERMISVRFPLRAHKWFSEKRSSLFFILPSWLYGLVWGTLPMLGWSQYAIESHNRHRCSIDLASKSLHVQSYNYTLLVFCFVLPIVAMSICFIIVKKELNKMLQSAKISTGEKSCISESSRKAEKAYSFVVFVMLATFLTAWTPYTICVFYVSLKGSIPQSLLDWSAYLGKSSTCYNPIIYALLYKDFRRALIKTFPLANNVIHTEVSQTGRSNSRVRSSVVPEETTT